jgi:hypothetical protein
MLTPRHVAVAGLSVLALAAAGCGSSGSSGGDSTQAKKDDAVAKSNARTLQTAMEVCFVDQQTYAACKAPADAQVPLGSGDGKVEVSKATDAGYTLVAHSKSGTNFEVVKDVSGAASRSCDKAGKGLCPDGGSW